MPDRSVAGENHRCAAAIVSHLGHQARRQQREYRWQFVSLAIRFQPLGRMRSRMPAVLFVDTIYLAYHAAG